MYQQRRSELIYGNVSDLHNIKNRLNIVYKTYTHDLVLFQHFGIVVVIFKIHFLCSETTPLFLLIYNMNISDINE